MKLGPVALMQIKLSAMRYVTLLSCDLGIVAVCDKLTRA